MPKILLTIPPEACPDGMNPSQLFDSRAHLDGWLKENEAKFKHPTDDKVKPAVAKGALAWGEAKQAKLEDVADDFDNTPPPEKKPDEVAEKPAPAVPTAARGPLP